MLNPERYALLPPSIPGGLPLLGAPQSPTEGSHQSEPNSPQQSSTKHGAGDKNPIMEHGVYIRVRRSLIQLPSTAATTLTTATHWPLTADPPTTNLPSAHLYLIEGTIQDIGRYTGAMVDWVIKVAHLICSPFRQGRVYTHTTGTPYDWYDQDMGTDWRLIVPGDQLRPGIYEFDADFSIVLSQLSLRRSYSIPSTGAESIEKTLYQHLEICEGGRCGVTRAWGRSPTSFLNVWAQRVRSKLWQHLLEQRKPFKLTNTIQWLGSFFLVPWLWMLISICWAFITTW